MYAQKESRRVAQRRTRSTLARLPSPALGRPGPRAPSSSASRVRPTSARAGRVSARATSIAASSRAPSSTWASGRTGCGRISPGLDRRLQAGLDQAEPVVGGDLAPAVPAEHRGGVVQRDLLRLRLGAAVEERLDAGPHRLQRRLSSSEPRTTRAIRSVELRLELARRRPRAARACRRSGGRGRRG